MLLLGIKYQLVNVIQMVNIHPNTGTYNINHLLHYNL